MATRMMEFIMELSRATRYDTVYWVKQNIERRDIGIHEQGEKNMSQLKDVSECINTELVSQ